MLQCEDFETEDRATSEINESARPNLPGDPPPVRILLLAFMCMFQGYGAMAGNPQKALKLQLGVVAAQSGDYQDAVASFQVAKLTMRIAQIAFLVFLPPNGIVYLSYAVMFVALLVPLVLVWGCGITALWVVYLQYSLGGIALGLFEGTFLSVISSLGKDTKTFVIMGSPLGFAVCNIVLGTFLEWGMPAFFYYVYAAGCMPFAAVIFYRHAPAVGRSHRGKGCGTFLNSLLHPRQWLPQMLPWLFAKFVGTFALEDGFPLLFNTFNTDRVPVLSGPAGTENTVPFAYYAAWYWFPLYAAGDTVSRRIPQYIELKEWSTRGTCLMLAIVMGLVGEALAFFLVAIVTGIAAFIANFGNGFIYGLSAEYIDGYIPEEHRYAAYNLWCLSGDLGGFAGQGSFSVWLANHAACAGKHYTYVCHRASERVQA